MCGWEPDSGIEMFVHPAVSLRKRKRTGTLVHHAARGGAAQCIRVLLEHGAGAQ